MLDEIDVVLLNEINQNPGQSLASALKPLLGTRSKRRLYYRLFELEAQAFIKVDRSEKRLAKATITAKGEATIKGREDPCPAQEARSS
jgi:hypothetical protein